MNQSLTTVVFSHGQESGPWGSKITAMAKVVAELGLAAESVDYRGIDDPGERVGSSSPCARNSHPPWCWWDPAWAAMSPRPRRAGSARAVCF